MKDEPEKAAREAVAWLVSAKHSLVDAQSDSALASVSCAQSIHCIIRANDALMLHFYKVKPTRHDDVPTGFAKLVRENKVQKEDEAFRGMLTRAMREKSGADYGKGSFSYEDAKWYAEKAEEFVAAVKKYI